MVNRVARIGSIVLVALLFVVSPLIDFVYRWFTDRDVSYRFLIIIPVQGLVAYYLLVGLLRRFPRAKKQRHDVGNGG